MIRSLRLSIIVTTCDRSGTLRRAIESAISVGEQQVGAEAIDVEVILVNDGKEELVGIPQLGTQGIRRFRTGGYVGVTRARNLGLRYAAGDYVVFLDDDDELVPDGVRSALRAAGQSELPRPVAAVMSLEEVDSRGYRLLRRDPPRSSRGNGWILSDGLLVSRRDMAAFNALVAPREALLAIGGWDERLRASEHTDLFVRLNSIASIEGVNQLGYRMHHADGLPRLTRSHEDRARAMWITYRKHRAILANNPKADAWYLGKLAMMRLRAGQWARAVWAALRSIKRDPRRRGALRQLLLALGGPITVRNR